MAMAQQDASEVGATELYALDDDDDWTFCKGFVRDRYGAADVSVDLLSVALMLSSVCGMFVPVQQQPPMQHLREVTSSGMTLTLVVPAVFQPLVAVVVLIYRH